jgi:hypothetical protein
MIKTVCTHIPLSLESLVFALFGINCELAVDSLWTKGQWLSHRGRGQISCLESQNNLEHCGFPFVSSRLGLSPGGVTPHNMCSTSAYQKLRVKGVFSVASAGTCPQFHLEPHKKPTGIYKNSPSPHLRPFFVNCPAESHRCSAYKLCPEGSTHDKPFPARVPATVWLRTNNDHVYGDGRRL